MAPSRRRGASKAAVAAAACRRWKVGDLVLAKVKGFPAWPATVSEPEKWGYQADWKKVLVHFFGTQQIAFCNPADVEAFTEEKKQYLLTKRQGKGADFVRAVQEIIESYENSKKLDQVDQNSDEDVTLGDAGNSKESSANMESKDQNEMSEAAVAVTNGPNLAFNVTKTDSLQDKEPSAEQPLDDVAVTAKPVITTYTSRKRSGGSRSRKRASVKTDSAVDMSSSLFRLDSGRLQSFIISSNDGNKSGVDASTEIIFERSLRRNKRIRKSPDVSEWHGNVDSSAFVSNGSIGDNGSEIVTLDSDSLSLNDNSTQDSACKPEHCETVFECLEGDVELSKGLDFQIKAVVIKKKRKPNRKQVTDEAADPPGRLKTGMELDRITLLQNSVQNSQNAGKILNERHNKEDGDEHLPLVKRARVRMGKLSTLEVGSSNLSQSVEKTSIDAAVNPIVLSSGLFEVERTSEDILVTSSEHIGPTTSFNDDCADHNSSDFARRSSDNASPQKVCSQIPGNGLHILISKENQPFGGSVDGEAALPPSKRLHRALEAMSANAAEQEDPYAESSAMKTLINGSWISSSSHVVTEGQESNASEDHNVESLIRRGSDFRFSVGVPEAAVKSPLDAVICNQSMDDNKSLEHTKPGYCKEPGKSCFRGLSVRTGTQQSTEDLTPNNDEKHSRPRFDQGSVDQLSLAKNKGDMDAGDEIANKDVATSECSQMNSRMISQTSEALKVTSQSGSSMRPYYAEGTEPLGSQIYQSPANDMLEESKEIKYDHRQKDASYVSISNDHLGEKDVLVTQSSPVLADETESPVHTSPTTTSVCHVSTSESTNFIQISGVSSPNNSQQNITTFTKVEEKIESAVPQRPKSVGKLNTYAEAHAALSSFEGMLGSLTRTKESIGRATRIAIDCAKFSVSSKVVEILARNLESEPSMHRRVDLFFLVDSIAQYSRCFKGDVGGIYLSAIQAVLPRLVSAAAPAGNFAQENRRQCKKVLRLWHERKILPESVIRNHMRELESLCSSSSHGAYSRRSARTERALDDPVRDMEGMLVDEYGSNSSFQLPGFCMLHMLKDKGGGSDSDGESFEAVTPEYNSGTPEEQENTYAVEKHTHILEDVDGELEMEDVAPACEVEGNLTGCMAGVSAASNLHQPFEQHFSLPNAPPLPQDVPPSSPPLPTSPPPPRLAPSAPHTRIHQPYMNNVDSKLHSTNSHNMHEDLSEYVAQHSGSRTNPSISNGVHHHTSECREPMQHFDSTSSFSGYPVRPVNNAQHADVSNFHHKPYPPRPPQPPPSNQFSYVQAGQHVKPRRETTPPSYHNRYHSSYNGDGGIFYNNNERMRPAPYEPGDGWRYPPPNFRSPRYPDKARAPYPPGPFGGPSQEPSRIHHQEWPLPPRGMHQRNFTPYRPYSECALPVSNRAPSIWPPI